MSHSPASSLPGLLPAALDRDPARPLVTFYDDATGERVELSVATFANWVAKTANLLVDDLGAEAGTRVAVRLPLHWQTAVWLGACWALGAVPVIGAADAAGATDADTDVDVLVCGPTLPEPLPRRADVVALALRPLGGRFTEPLPSGVLDYAVEVPGHGDRFVAPATGADGSVTCLEVAGVGLSGDDVLAETRALADRWSLASGGRLLSSLDAATLPGALALLAVPLVADGSAVLVRNPADGDDEARVAAERVTARASA